MKIQIINKELWERYGNTIIPDEKIDPAIGVIEDWIPRTPEREIPKKWTLCEDEESTILINEKALENLKF